MTDPTTEIDVNLDIQEILLVASQHDIPKLRHLIRDNAQVGNPANVKDPETGFTPLHAAIAACEPDDDDDDDEKTNGAGAAEGQDPEHEKVKQAGLETVRFLLQEGAIWNDLDLKDETPGCLAKRLGLDEIYGTIVDAGVRAELLLNRLDGYEPLSEDDEEDDEQGDQEGETKEEQATITTTEEQVPELVEAITSAGAAATTTTANPDNTHYLTSNLTFQNDRLLDADQNGVMMAWESDIMSRSAKNLLPTPGLRVLNIGHGMGIIDSFFQEQAPSSHHIVEAHPDVLVEMKRKGWHEKPGVVIHEGKWSEVLPKLAQEGVTFDAIYYDTFAESYADFKEFFSELVIGILEDGGRWGFFNGMGADRQISYDVYQKVVEMDLFEAGYDVEWEEIPVPKLEGEWNGVKRPYWVVDSYRLPLCKFME